MIDLNKLTPAPWHLAATGYLGVVVEEDHNIRFVLRNVEGRGTDAAFAALARNAFDVLMRRQFAVIKIEEGVWCVMRDGDALPGFWIGFTADHPTNIQGERLEWPDPFTALIEADEWYKKNVENKYGSSHA